MKRKFTLITLMLAAVLAMAAGGVFLWNSTSDEPAEQAMASTGLSKAGMVDPKNGKKIKYWVAPMDPTYIRTEPGKSPMGMDLVPVYEEEGEEKKSASTIRVDPVTVQNMGVRLAPVVRKPLAKSIRAFGNITYDERRLFTVNTKFDGWIEKLYVNYVGQQVKKGKPLFDIYSPDLVTAQEEYLLSLRHYNQLSKTSPGRVQDNARRLLTAARKRLSYWDISDAHIRRIEKSGSPAKSVTIYSPAGGVVMKKSAFEGHYVKAGQHQFEIADLSKVWVDVEVYEYELPWISQHMPATMDLSYIPGRLFKGRVLYIYPYLSEKTRTARLRLEFDNADLALKPEMYANIHLETANTEPSLVIPQEAVIDSGVRKVTFVAKGKGRFEPREIELGVEGNGGSYQVLSGLSEGENVVTSAQFMLDSESRLREAIQKMLEVSSTEDESKKTDDLDMSGLSMKKDLDADLDMSGLTMSTQENNDSDSKGTF